MAQDPQQIGKYQIVELIGRGGMGAVYKAFDPAIRRNVAIKAIDKSSLEEEERAYILARFRHEAQAVGRLVHPRIIAVYDYGEDGDFTFMVMELVQGKSLYEHLKQGATYDLREVAEIIAQELEDPRVQRVTVSGASVSKDLSNATLYVTLPADAEIGRAHV